MYLIGVTARMSNYTAHYQLLQAMDRVFLNWYVCQIVP